MNLQTNQNNKSNRQTTIIRQMNYNTIINKRDDAIVNKIIPMVRHRRVSVLKVSQLMDKNPKHEPKSHTGESLKEKKITVQYTNPMSG